MKKKYQAITPLNEFIDGHIKDYNFERSCGWNNNQLYCLRKDSFQDFIMVKNKTDSSGACRLIEGVIQCHAGRSYREPYEYSKESDVRRVEDPGWVFSRFFLNSSVCTGGSNRAGCYEISEGNIRLEVKAATRDLQFKLPTNQFRIKLDSFVRPLPLAKYMYMNQVIEHFSKNMQPNQYEIKEHIFVERIILQYLSIILKDTDSDYVQSKLLKDVEYKIEQLTLLLDSYEISTPEFHSLGVHVNLKLLELVFNVAKEFYPSEELLPLAKLKRSLGRYYADINNLKRKKEFLMNLEKVEPKFSELENSYKSRFLVKLLKVIKKQI